MSHVLVVSTYVRMRMFARVCLQNTVHLDVTARNATIVPKNFTSTTACTCSQCAAATRKADFSVTLISAGGATSFDVQKKTFKKTGKKFPTSIIILFSAYVNHIIGVVVDDSYILNQYHRTNTIKLYLDRRS